MGGQGSNDRRAAGHRANAPTAGRHGKATCTLCGIEFKKQSELNLHNQLRHRVVDDQRKDE